MARQSEYGIRSSDLDDDDIWSERLAALKMDVVLREISSDAPPEIGADGDEAEDDLCSVPPSSGDSELSTVIVNPDLGKIWRYLRGPDLGLGTKMSESDWYSTKGSESFEFECDRDSTWETVSASEMVPESRAGVSGVSKRMLLSFKTNSCTL